METALKRSSKRRVWIAFLFLFVFIVALSYGAYFITRLAKLQESVAADESQALQGITEVTQIDQALRREPANRVLQLMAMATRTAIETSAAAEKLANEIEPPALSKPVDVTTASRSDLEALRRDLKIAEANATSFMPRYTALIKTERDKVANYALSLHVDKDIAGRLLQAIDTRQAKASAFTSDMLSASADYYRAYESYVAILAEEFGSYSMVNGQFTSAVRRTKDRYNVASRAMTAAAKRLAELEGVRRTLKPPQQATWELFVGAK